MPESNNESDNEKIFTGLDVVKIARQRESGPSTSLLNTSMQKSIGGWLHPFTRFHKIPVSSRVWVYLFIMSGYCFIVSHVANKQFPTHVFKEAGAAAFSSVILGLLLVFRTNTSYDRWWEGRKLWGQLVNDSRNLCLKIRCVKEISPAEQVRLGELVISFAYALKNHLRSSVPNRSLPGLSDLPMLAGVNAPVHLAGKIFEMINQFQLDNKIDGMTRLHLDSHLKAFMDICGACERIKNSPLALSYRAFMRQGITLNLLCLPWYVVPEFSLFWSLPLILVGTYFLIGVELIAEDIEEPFGRDGDDLPLDTICANIQRTITDILPIEQSLQYTSTMKALSVDPLKS